MKVKAQQRLEISTLNLLEGFDFNTLFLQYSKYTSASAWKVVQKDYDDATFAHVEHCIALYGIQQHVKLSKKIMMM